MYYTKKYIKDKIDGYFKFLYYKETKHTRTDCWYEFTNIQLFGGTLTIIFRKKQKNFVIEDDIMFLDEPLETWPDSLPHKL